MSKKRVILKKKEGIRDGTGGANVYPSKFKKRGVEYFGYIVRGWKENGKWQRKQFKKKEEAEAYADSVNINLKNSGQKRSLVLSALDDKQIQQAEQAYSDLGESYSLPDAVAFFLRHHRAPDFTITVLSGLKFYLDEKEREGIRVTTTKKTKNIITRFANYAGDPLVHTVTEESVLKYLKSLRAKDGVNSAKKKTWNNHRNELAAFYIWASCRDLTTNRPWTFHNPTEYIKAYSNQRVAEERPDIATTSPEDVAKLFTHLMNFKEGRLVKWFALAYFAGIRPSTDHGELSKLSDREDELINLVTGRIMITADIAKTKDSRPVRISENLKAWLDVYRDKPILPPNFKNDYRKVREKFSLQPDETRHTFISYHIALHRSIGDTAQQAGNSERMIKKHYLDHRSKEEGHAFFSIFPATETREAIVDTQATPDSTAELRVIQARYTIDTPPRPIEQKAEPLPQTSP